MAKKIQSVNASKPDIFFYAALIAVACLIALYPTLNNDFVNWDDIVYVMNNTLIRSFSWANLKIILTGFYMGNYHPLPLLSFALDYHTGGLDPKIYHAHNLLLHAANALLIFWFVFRLFRILHIAGLVALLFAIHPMHVESVAWISERKDLLYTFWFFSAAISYLYYLQFRQTQYYVMVLIFFLLSLLSKAQAVTLPLVLVITDMLLSRNDYRRMITEKIPFFLFSVFFGVLAVLAQEHDHSIRSVDVKGFEPFFYGNYGLLLYLVKLFIPLQLCCLYEYPFTQLGYTPWYVYLSPLVLIAIFFIVYYCRNRLPWISYGLLFFFLTLLPVLQFLPVGKAFMADRYTYIPYTGLFIILAKYYHEHRKLFSRFLYGWIILLLFISFNRSKVWKNSITLWSDVINKYPRSVTAYVNRGFIYNNDTREYHKAIKDCESGLKIDSTESKLYYNRAISNKYLGRYDHAIDDFEKAVRYSPGGYDIFMDRGIMYTEFIQQYDSGIADFRRVLKFAPLHKDALYNMAVSYYKKQQYDSALVYCQRASDLDPEFGKAHFLLSLLYANRNAYHKALDHAVIARQKGEQVSDQWFLFLQRKTETP